ncbi:hypothetical protein HNP00_004126 [Arthrobacter sp. AZCC_0090]|nr:hypothetical protein [Arthrobacter sp. AZCC_0090]
MTGLEDNLERIAAITREAGFEFSGIGGYAWCDNDDVERMYAATTGARTVRTIEIFPRFSRIGRDADDALDS